MKAHLFRLPALLLWLLAGSATAPAGDWPQWRGVARDGHVAAGEPVPTSLAAEPKVVWRLEIGGGFSSPVVQNGRLAYLDARDAKEVAHLIDAQTGKEIWQVPYADVFGDEWGPGPRSTPIMDGDRVYVQSCNGEFKCLNVADGKTIWGCNFEKDFGIRFLGNKSNEGTATRRGNNGSGLIEGERLFVPVGSPNGASLVCFNKLTGKVLWQAGNDEAAYSSPIIATLAGVKQVVFLSADSLAGFEFATGKQLWRAPLRTGAKRHACTPVIVGDTVAVNSQSIGLVCFKITKDGEGLAVMQLWANKDLKINVATPVLMDHYLYTQGEMNSKNFACVDALTGKTQWKQPGFGDIVSATIGFGKNLLVQTDKGELVLVAADPAKYTELGRVQICGATWSHPAYANGKLYVREGTLSGWKLTCFDLMAMKP